MGKKVAAPLTVGRISTSDFSVVMLHTELNFSLFGYQLSAVLQRQTLRFFGGSFSTLGPCPRIGQQRRVILDLCPQPV